MRKRIIYIVAVMFLTGCQTAEAPQQDITPQTQTVHCTFVGDLLYEQPYYDWIEKDSQDKGYYDLVKPFFQKDDLSIANLETPIGGTELKISGVGYSFNASREIGEQVASLGLEVVSTANNHANDRGNKGIDNTLKFLKEKDIISVGTYENQDDRNKGRYQTINGIRFGYVSYTYATNQIVQDKNRSKVGLFNRPSDRKFTSEYKTILKKEVEETQGKDARTQRFLTAENGCLGGCTSGTTIYAGYEFSAHPGVHEDQEGFYVLEGEGYARLGDLEFPIEAGDSFIALPGVPHTIKTKPGCQPVKVFWFHNAV